MNQQKNKVIMINKSLLLSLLLLAGTIFGQTVKVPVSTDIQARNGKQFYVHTVQKGQTLYSIAKAYHVGLDEIYFANPETKQGIRVGQKIWIPTVNKETEIKHEIKASRFDFFYHVASAGETIEHISSVYLIPKRYILLANPGLKGPLKQGEYVKIPVESAFPTLDGKVSGGAVQNTNTGAVSPQQTDKTPPANTAHTPNRVQKPAKYSPVGNPENNIQKNGGAKKQTAQHAVKQDFITHTVKKKETLYSISRLYGLTPEDLYKANPGLTQNISVGQSIKIPKKKISTDFVYYQAQRKTSLKKVARLYNVDLTTLTANNPSIGKKVISGQVVRIPVGPQALALAENQKNQETETPANNGNAALEPGTPAAAFGHCQARPHNRTFKVALMVPLYLEETDSLDMTEFMIRQQKNFAPFRFIEFLEGALIASDSLRKQGMNLKLYVYDVDQTLTKTSKVLTHPELKQMDLIIGPFYSRSFDQTALFASHFNIPIVNPLTFRSGILHRYNNVVKVKPRQQAEASQVSHLIKNDYVHDKIFVISQTSYKSAREVSTLQDSIREVLPDSAYIPNLDLINLGIAVTQRSKNEELVEKEKENPDSQENVPATKITYNDTLYNYNLENQPVDPETLKDAQYDTSAIANQLVYINYSRDSLHPFNKYASALRNNLVVLYGDNKSFIMDAMNRLNVLRDTFDIKIIGLPTWEAIGTLNLQQMDNMEVTYPGSYFVDYSSPEYKRLNTLFYQRYATAPNRYGVLGFDIAYFFMRSVFLYGNRFLQCLPNNIHRGISTQYEFKPAKPGSNNFENTYWNWMRIKDKQLIRLSDTLVGSPSGQEK